MELESVPTILDIPPKLRPILTNFNLYRYFLIEGGRGGAKTQTISRIILYLCDRYSLRVVCAREQQININESVYTVFRDLILSYGLNFEIQAQKITHRITGATINFRGFREQGSFSIQGLEGVDIVFCDEAQALSKTTLNVLIPTIRKETARLFFSMNRHGRDDPAYVSFVGRADCLHIKINYDENPFCTQALIREAEECRRRSESDFSHIWLGNPLDQTEDAVFSIAQLEEAGRKSFSFQNGYGERVAGFDIARFGEDLNAAVIFQQQDLRRWELIHAEEWGKKDLNFTSGRILEILREFNVSSACIDTDGLGSGPFDTLTFGRGLDFIHPFHNGRLSFDENRDYGNTRTLWAFKLEGLIASGQLALKNEKLISELLTIKYKFSTEQQRLLVSKDEMRKKGIKSPNMADAAIYAASMIEKIGRAQQAPYEVGRRPAYSKEGNLFAIAGGIR